MNTIFITLSFLCAFASAASVEVTVDEDVIAQGQTAHIRCSISNFEPGWLVHWYKRQAEGQEVQIATNDDINAVFTETERYSGKIETVDDVTTFILTIENAVAEDSGDIGCNIPKAGVTETQFTSLSVAVPVDTIALYGLDAGGMQTKVYHDGQTIEFEEGDQYYFRCVASGSNPAPTIELTLGDESVNDQFKFNKSYTVGDGKPGLKHVTFKAEMVTTSAIVIHKDQNAQRFTCSARVEETDPVSISIIPMMKFVPVVACEKTDYYLPAMYKDLVVTCVVKADPTPEHIAVYWQEVDGKNRTLTEDSKHFGNYRMEIKQGERQDEQIVYIRVERLFPQMFRKYTFIAQSSEGSVYETIELRRDTSEESGANHIIMSSWMLIIISTFYFIL